MTNKLTSPELQQAIQLAIAEEAIANLATLKINTALSLLLRAITGVQQITVDISSDAAHIRLQESGDRYWTSHDISLYYHSNYNQDYSKRLPAEFKLSWFSSNATKHDTDYLDYLTVLGVISKSLRDSTTIIKDIEAGILEYRTVTKKSKDLNRDCSNLREQLRATAANTEVQRIKDIILSGHQVTCEGTYHASKRNNYYISAFTVQKVTKGGKVRVDLHNHRAEDAFNHYTYPSKLIELASLIYMYKEYESKLAKIAA